MYYVDPYMFAGHFYEPWPVFEYEYRYPDGFPWSGGSAMPGGSTMPGMGGGAPQGPPPSQIPAKPPKPQGAQGAVFLVEPVTIRPCLFRFTYVWLTNGRSFWFYPIVLGRRSVGGFYWNASQRRWVYFALDTNLIDVVSCSF
ncbi:hypothetical protein AAGG74_21855 [Bacillus mexicanus]|uniref:hypothetical protein n=1 Tax=Bacillus TaxID=1386 RepID=UPI00138A60D8|nr:hypothetical protein BTW01_10980 [Bacillus sp. SKDU12]